MKELARLSQLEPEEFYDVFYCQLVQAYMVGIKDMFTDDLILYESPERFLPIEVEIPIIQKKERNPLQGELKFKQL